MYYQCHSVKIMLAFTNTIRWKPPSLRTFSAVTITSCSWPCRTQESKECARQGFFLIEEVWRGLKPTHKYQIRKRTTQKETCSSWNLSMTNGALPSQIYSYLWHSNEIVFCGYKYRSIYCRIQ